jgi:hypothetical protein
MIQCQETHGKCKNHSNYGLYLRIVPHTEAQCRKKDGHKKQHKCGCCHKKWIDGEVISVTCEPSVDFSQLSVLSLPPGVYSPGFESTQKGI